MDLLSLPAVHSLNCGHQLSPADSLCWCDNVHRTGGLTGVKPRKVSSSVAISELLSRFASTVIAGWANSAGIFSQSRNLWVPFSLLEIYGCPFLFFSLSFLSFEVLGGEPAKALGIKWQVFLSRKD